MALDGVQVVELLADVGRSGGSASAQRTARHHSRQGARAHLPVDGLRSAPERLHRAIGDLATPLRQTDQAAHQAGGQNRILGREYRCTNQRVRFKSLLSVGGCLRWLQWHVRLAARWVSSGRQRNQNAGYDDEQVLHHCVCVRVVCACLPRLESDVATTRRFADWRSARVRESCATGHRTDLQPRFKNRFATSMTMPIQVRESQAANIACWRTSLAGEHCLPPVSWVKRMSTCGFLVLFLPAMPLPAPIPRDCTNSWTWTRQESQLSCSSRLSLLDNILDDEIAVRRSHHQTSIGKR